VCEQLVSPHTYIPFHIARAGRTCSSGRIKILSCKAPKWWEKQQSVDP